MTDVRVYVAASLERVEVARGLAKMLEQAGCAVCSTWHELVEPGDVDPTDEPTREEILRNNLRDLLLADVVLVYTAQGTPRATMCEAGFAIALMKPIVWLLGANGEGNCIFTAHSLSRVVQSETDVVPAIAAQALTRRAA